MPEKPKIQINQKPEWYVMGADGVTYGPFEITQISDFIKQGRIVSDTRVQHPKHTNGVWGNASSVPYIAKLFQPAESSENPYSLESKSFPPTDKKPPNLPSMETGWMLRRGDGVIFGPFTFNDLQNFASQGKLTIETCVQCKSRFGNDWVAVGRVPELISLIRQAADISHLSPNAHSSARKAADYFTSNRITTIISGISFVFAAVIWLATLIGFPLALIAIAMALFEFVSASTESKRDFVANRDRYKLIGILEIVCGFITLGNLIAIICGVVNLVSLPEER
jgi:hypothetical protein